MAWNPLDRITREQETKLRQFKDLLLEFNQRINLISREDEEEVFEHHILHSLSLTRKSFPGGSVVVDWGTGGGLPAIPLAIVFPDVLFVGVDAVGKKVQAVRVMARRLGLDNVVGWHGRAETFDGRADFSVSRATAPLADLWAWHQRAAVPSAENPQDGLWRRGLVCLKGGDLTDEKRALPKFVNVGEIRLGTWFEDGYYDEKVILECGLASPR